MRKSYLTTGLAIAIDALAIGAVNVIFSFIYWLTTGAKGAYLPVLSNLLFIEGIVIFVFGGLIEFFHKGEMPETYRMLMSPLKIIGVQEEKEDIAEPGEYDTGWMLLFLGAALIVLSVAALFEFLI
jgi:hypothetical protein